MSVSTNNFKNGMCIMHDGKMWTIVEFQHVKPGKGGAFVRTKLKEVKSGRVVEHTFRAGEKFDDVRMETKKMQYLYNDGSSFHFMDNSNYEQYELSADQVGDDWRYLTENLVCSMVLFNGMPITMTPPNHVIMKIEFCEPGAKGDTATNVTKPVQVETGAEFLAPIFINQGDVIKIDTRTGEYVERVRT